MKDFNRYLPSNLDITVGDRTYSIKPPTKKIGTQLAALLATSMNRIKGEQPTAKDAKILEEVPDDLEVGRLSLGNDVYDQMLADEQPGAWIDRAATYALWYWVMGEAAADAMAERMFSTQTPDEAGEAAPKDSKGPEDWAPYGIGEPDEHGIYPRYRLPPRSQRPQAPGEDADGGVSWAWVFTHWRLIVADLLQYFGIDFTDPAHDERSWAWASDLIAAVFDIPESRSSRARA